MRQSHDGLELAIPSQNMRTDDQSFCSENTMADSGLGGYLRSNSGSETSTMATHRNSTGSMPVVRLSVIEPPIKPFSRRSQDSTSPRPRRPASVGSIYDVMSPGERTFLLKRNLTIMFSCIYAVFLASFGAIVYITEYEPDKRYISEIFTTCTALVGLAWLMFFHVDLFLYKRRVVTKVMQSSEEQIDRVMNSSAETWDFNNPWAGEYAGNAPYRFLTGRHSGSFYLKAGLAAFCFGHVIYEGLQLGQEILNYVQEDRYVQKCGQASGVAVHLIRPLYSFYQLFIVFKYANIIINKYKELARFALMHIIATCLCFWFSAIVQDALEDHHLHHELEELHAHHPYESSNETKPVTKFSCSAGAILTDNNMQVLQYLYPFTIEFNLLLVGVWFVVWNNIGKDVPHADPHHFRQKINTEHGVEEVTFQSNLVISADCHASNKGLFAGLFLLMASIISVIVFFVTMSTAEYTNVGITLHSTQETLLTVASLIGSVIASKQLCKLDFNLHPITFLDDVLLFVPLPFFFIHFTLTMMAEIHAQNAMRIVISLLTIVQVIVQTPFISDGLRRCSNRHNLRYEKPGREIVTFLIVCNLTMWIINTFEENSVEPHHAQLEFFGDFIWMFVKHTTLPLMLFYRFHASVCLADIWKSAYERGQ